MLLKNSNYNLQRMPKNIGKIAAARLCHKSFDLAGDKRTNNCPIGRLKRTLCNVLRYTHHQK
jgi:hypothetical protein